MVEENTIACEHVVSVTVLLYNPEAILLSHSVRRIGMERRILILRNLFHLTIELRCGGLIDAACVSKTTDAHCLQDTQHTHGINISRVFR